MSDNDIDPKWIDVLRYCIKIEANARGKYKKCIRSNDEIECSELKADLEDKADMCRLITKHLLTKKIHKKEK